MRLKISWLTTCGFLSTQLTRETLRSSSLKVTLVSPEDPAYFLPRRFSDLSTVDVSQIKGEHIWIAFRADSWDESQPPLNLLKNAGYQVVGFKALEAQGQQAYLVELQHN